MVIRRRTIALPASAAADKNGELSVREVRSWFDQGEQEVIGLRLRDNTELWVTPDHKILTERGWRLAGELSSGDRVARPRRGHHGHHQTAVHRQREQSAQQCTVPRLQWGPDFAVVRQTDGRCSRPGRDARSRITLLRNR